MPNGTDNCWTDTIAAKDLPYGWYKTFKRLVFMCNIERRYIFFAQKRILSALWWRRSSPHWGETSTAEPFLRLPQLYCTSSSGSFISTYTNQVELVTQAIMRQSPINNSTLLEPKLLSTFSLVSDVDLSLWLQEIKAALWVFRALVLVPLMRLMVLSCMIMSVMLFAEKVFMGSVSLYVKLARRKPEKVYKWEPLGCGDEEMGSLTYPMVLVQIPMYNEKEVYQLSIGAACNLSWPSDRVVIQVLDDSTDPFIKELVRKECERWAERGKNIKYETRANRDGYKAGALAEAMKYPYVAMCDHVAIFDADFQPEPDFLLRTVPFLVHNPEIALVQARWKFVNADECMMTRIQEMSMDYHFKVEQESGSSTHSFFGFNGTAGVWRLHALKEAGGWNHRTTVEDMDLAVRASLRGWKFVYVGNVKVKSELPSTFKAYRNQQHRWSCGPANLFRKMAIEIVRNPKVSVMTKSYVIYSFFIVRRIVAHIVTFFFYCVVIPTSVFFPEVEVSTWGVIYIPTTITLLNSVGTPSSFHLIPFWILFENVMAMNRSKAVLIGLFEAGRVNEWVVTDKLGDTLKKKADKPLAKKNKTKFLDGLNLLEISFSVYLFVCALYDLLYGHYNYFIYIFPQSLTFFIMGINYVGTFIPNAS